MAQIAVQKATLTGVIPTYVAASAGGDTFINNANTTFEVKNAAATPTTVTILSRVNCNMGGTHDIVVTIPATTTKIIGPFSAGRFNDENKLVQVNYSAVTTVTVAAITH